MKTPASPHFRSVDLADHFNARRSDLRDGLGKRPSDSSWSDSLRGPQVCRGIPFLFGANDDVDVLVLKPGEGTVDVDIGNQQATYLIFVQAVVDRPPTVPDRFGDVASTDSYMALQPVDGNDVGDLVSCYSLHYDDGSQATVPILRRIGIQQRHISWGAQPFAVVSARSPSVIATHAEDQILGRAPNFPKAFAEWRTVSGRKVFDENLWLYALPNPNPGKPVSFVRLEARSEASLIYAMSTTQLLDHPLRLQGRRKMRLRLPDGIHLNALGELDTDDRADSIGMDLGQVMSARGVLEYSQSNWVGGAMDVQPVRSASEVIVEYSAHPDARLFLRAADGGLIERDLRSIEAGEHPAAPLQAIAIEPSTRPVRFRIVEKGTGRPVAARLHVHGPHGEYLPPKGHHRKVNTSFVEDYYGEFANGLNQYCYVDGACTVDLPIGSVFVGISQGFEVQPQRRVVEIEASTESVTLELDKVLRWREKGWVTSDTHVHVLSPTTALLEGKAEGVNVVNLLATQWGEMFTNVGDFDGRTTLGAKDFGGEGEFLVRVGTENRMEVLGHISLLGYEGPMIDPLCTGGPDEAAIGDTLEITMAGWAERCRAQGGLVVLPHSPNPQAERAADIVLGLVDAVELASVNPHEAQITAYGLLDWYRYLNIGYRLPLVGGTDKMGPTMLLGGLRTYVQMGPAEFTYRNWMDAIRSGDTFITVGPLVDMTVEGRRPGRVIRLGPGGGTVTIDWRVESVSVAPTRLEIIRNGEVIEEVRCDGMAFDGHLSLQLRESCWLAIRVRGSLSGRDGDIAAHTGALYVEVGDKPLFATADAAAVLAQIEGVIAYVDTLAPRFNEPHHSKLRASLGLAHHRLHQRLHELGAGHSHTPLHPIHTNREH